MKDEIQYGDYPKYCSPSSEYLMQVFTDDPNKTTNITLNKIEINLKDIKSSMSDELQQQALVHTPPAYTAATTAQLTHKSC